MTPLLERSNIFESGTLRTSKTSSRVDKRSK
nr:MAG TPA: hypothetical protein [Caudoviricetes sp.]